MDVDDFEWELSKENVKRLPGGRSVQLLNKILFTQHTSEFQLKRQQLRQWVTRFMNQNGFLFSARFWHVHRSMNELIRSVTLFYVQFV